MSGRQFKRKASLLVVRPGTPATATAQEVPGTVLDLSDAHFRFRTVQQDVQAPNNCNIRIYNLSDTTVRSIVKDEFTRVIVQAGYEETGAGVVFDGTIKQFRLGRENATDKYLDLLVADGDIAYNFATVSTTLAAGSTPAQRVAAIAAEMAKKGVVQGNIMQFTGGVLPRGKVLFGMARVMMRQEAWSQGATWNITNGQLNVTPLDGYLPGEVVRLAADTGLIGLPEQTEEGLKATSLLNPRLTLGGLVQIDNRTINQLFQQNPEAAPIPYNQYVGIQNLATITADGIYRVYVSEFEGDTRGMPWYTHLTLLAVNPVTRRVSPFG